jgi:PAS domain S-box-containing protein
MEELTGVKAEQIIGTTNHAAVFYDAKRPVLCDFLIDGTQDKLGEFYSHFSRSSTLIENGLQAEGWFPNLNGKKRYLIFAASPVYNREGQLSAAIQTLQDLTTQKEVEEAYRESEKRLRAVISSAPIVLFAFDPQGNLILMEGKALEGMGLKPGQLVGLSAFEIYHDMPVILENMERVLKGETFNLTIEMGGRILEVFNAPVFGENGELVNTIGVSVDVTERRQAEADLEQERNFALQIMNTMGQGLMVSQNDGQLEYVNLLSARCWATPHSSYWVKLTLI